MTRAWWGGDRSRWSLEWEEVSYTRIAIAVILFVFVIEWL
jgi:hypothetical protein